MIAEYGPWVVSAVGIVGFHFAGKRRWWAWYINIANQLLWMIFALVTGQLGFLVSTIFYLPIFSNNAYQWTRTHIRAKKTPTRVIKDAKIGKITKVWEDDSGIHASILMDDGTTKFWYEEDADSQEKQGL